MTRLWQWRKYTIKDGHVDEFVHEWRTKLVPLREEFGYEFHKARI
jgi:hypothetical protein